MYQFKNYLWCPRKLVVLIRWSPLYYSLKKSYGIFSYYFSKSLKEKHIAFLPFISISVHIFHKNYHTVDLNALLTFSILDIHTILSRSFKYSIAAKLLKLLITTSCIFTTKGRLPLTDLQPSCPFPVSQHALH